MYQWSLIILRLLFKKKKKKKKRVKDFEQQASKSVNINHDIPKSQLKPIIFYGFSCQNTTYHKQNRE